MGDTALSGTHVVWTRRMLDGSWRVELGAPGERTLDLAKGPRVMPGVRMLVGLAASPQRVAWTDFTQFFFAHFAEPVQDRLMVAQPRPGTAVQVAGCTGMRGCRCTGAGDCSNGSRHFAAVDGDVLAYAEREEHNTIHIRRPGTAELRIPTDSRTVFGPAVVHLAGRFVTWRNPPFDVGVVYDWQAGREVYRVPSDERVAGIQGDGKLLTATRMGLRWRALPDGTPHDIPNPSPPGDAIGAAHLAGDGIAFETLHDDQHSAPQATLWAGGLDRQAHIVAEGAWAPAARNVVAPNVSGIGFDGHRLAWIAEPCGVATVMLAEDAATATSPPQPRCQAPRIEDTSRTSAPVTIRRARHGTLAVRLACPSGCRGRLEVTFVDDVPLTTLGARTVDLPPSPTATTVHVRPSKRGARLVQRERAVSFRLGPWEVPGVNVSIALLARDRGGEPVGASALGNLCRSKRPCEVPFDRIYP